MSESKTNAMIFFIVTSGRPVKCARYPPRSLRSYTHASIEPKSAFLRHHLIGNPPRLEGVEVFTLGGTRHAIPRRNDPVGIAPCRAHASSRGQRLDKDL